MPKVKQRKSLWEGPSGTGRNGGITQSLIGKYLCCPERFRIKVIEGLCPVDTFNHAIFYGVSWHLCEEFMSQGRDWRGPLKDYAKQQCQRYPTQQDQVDHWYNVCSVQFPIYVDHWSQHQDVKNRTPLLQEVAFDVPYKLPSGRSVRLRGRWDSVDLIEAGECNCGADRTGPSAEAHDSNCPAKYGTGVWLTEHKTKGDVDEQRIERQMLCDLQTMLYLTALEAPQGLASYATNGRHQLCGVRYNVVRRPLSGGLGSIRQKQGETRNQFYDRLSNIITEQPEHYFKRWQVGVCGSDLHKFRKQCLDPLLENILDDYEWWSWCYRVHGDIYNTKIRRHTFPDHYPRHWQMPFGIYNPLNDGGDSELDEYMRTGNTVGLQVAETLFNELE